MEKVIVIGSKGMLGEEVVRQLGEDQNYEVIGWDVEDIDITNHEETRQKIIAEEPDVIINCAAYNNVDEAESEDGTQKAMALNAEAPGNLAKIASELDVVLVHYVSDYVFDGEKGEYMEDNKKSPISKYGESKAKGENAIRENCQKHYLIRTSKLFGNPGQSENAKKSFFAVMLDLAKTKDELKVIDSEKSCFTYVPDLAKATKKLLEEKYDFGIYHIVNEGAVTWHEGVLEFFKIAGVENVKVVPVGPDEFPRAAKRAESSVLVNTKFPKLRHYTEAIKDWLEKKNDLS